MNLPGQWDRQIMSVCASDLADENPLPLMSHSNLDTTPMVRSWAYSARHIFPDVLNYVALWTISK